MTIGILPVHFEYAHPRVGDGRQMRIKVSAPFGNGLGQGIVEIFVLPQPEAVPLHDHRFTIMFLYIIKPDPVVKSGSVNQSC